MIIVTGGAGFIGCNLIRALNARGINDITVVDDLTDGKKFINLVGVEISDYIDKDTFIELIGSDDGIKNVKMIFHQGACSDTTEWDGKYMMANNYEYSVSLLHYAQAQKIPFIYASSAAVYGRQKIFTEDPRHENPLNVYGYSKYLFDQYVRKHKGHLESQVVGLRYFNVFGPHEGHKGKMASVMLHFNQQMKESNTIKLFEGSDDYPEGEQRRDFIYVKDVAGVNLWFMDNPEISGIYNLGTGKSCSFNDVGNAVINWHKNQDRNGKIEYIPFPENLKVAYQSFTEADMAQLEKAGYKEPFTSLEEGVSSYLDWLNRDDSPKEK